MDPEQTLRDAETHLRTGELDEAGNALAAYWAWRRGGGFQLADGDETARRLEQSLRQRQRSDDGPKPLADCLDEWQNGQKREENDP